MRKNPLIILSISITASLLALGNGPITLPDNQWTHIADVAPDPYGRELEPGRGAYWCYEPVNGVFLRYGGYTPTDDNSLWSFDLQKRKWENILKVDYSWPPPEDRPGAGAWWSMAYDSKRKVIWIFGGSGVVGKTHPEKINDIWQYNPVSKTMQAMHSKKAPGLSHGCRIVYDAKNDLIIRSPGYDGEWAAMHNRDSTWVYEPEANSWTGRQTKDSPKSAPGGVWVYDAGIGKTVFGALSKDGGPMITWLYDAEANLWSELKTGTAPVARVYCGATYDPNAKLVVIYGGVGRGGQGYAARGGGATLNDTWALDSANGIWHEIKTAPSIPVLPGNSKNRFVLPVAMDYDTKHKAVVVSAPTFGVWTLRLPPAGTTLPKLEMATLSPLPPQLPIPEKGIFPQAPLNGKLLKLEPNKWIKLEGGNSVGGGEVPMTYDEATGFCLRYGGCNDGGTTFASGYGNDLTAYDPATERWLALRWTDPCGPPRPANGCTRTYAYDTKLKVTWFAGGTAGNHLASSLPTGFEDKKGTWQYDGLRDRFSFIPTTGPQSGEGVVCCFDSINNVFISMTKPTWGDNAKIFVFNPDTMTWKISAPNFKDQYTFGTFVTSLKGLLTVDRNETGTFTKLHNAADGTWHDLKPSPDLPQNIGGRPTLAYDADHDVVLGLFKGQTWIYNVKGNSWKLLEVEKPGNIEECLVYDTRHKVFLGTRNMGDPMWAFRYQP